MSNKCEWLKKPSVKIKDWGSYKVISYTNTYTPKCNTKLSFPYKDNECPSCGSYIEEVKDGR
jgi:hypothetical protein